MRGSAAAGMKPPVPRGSAAGKLDRATFVENCVLRPLCNRTEHRVCELNTLVHSLANRINDKPVITPWAWQKLNRTPSGRSLIARMNETT